MTMTYKLFRRIRKALSGGGGQRRQGVIVPESSPQEPPLRPKLVAMGPTECPCTGEREGKPEAQAGIDRRGGEDASASGAGARPQGSHHGDNRPRDETWKETMTMKWKGSDLASLKDLVDAMSEVKNEVEAKQLRDTYYGMLPQREVAESNLGYCTGYLTREQGARCRAWMEVKHPLFDFDKHPDPTPEQLIRAGAIHASQTLKATRP